MHRTLNPVEVLAASVYHMVNVGAKDLYRPEIVWDKDPKTSLAGTKRETGKQIAYRPRVDDFRIEMFLQVWGSTALGFGGLGGAAMTEAYTVVIKGPSGEFCVYFDGRFAYMVNDPSDKFYSDLRDHNLNSLRNAHVYEKAPV